MGPLDEMLEDKRREYVRKHIEKYPCATALDEEQLEAAIDRILVQSHPDNIGRRDGRKPRQELGLALCLATDLCKSKKDPDVRLKLATDQAELLTKGYLEVPDDCWPNIENMNASMHETWKNMGGDGIIYDDNDDYDGYDEEAGEMQEGGYIGEEDEEERGQEEDRVEEDGDDLEQEEREYEVQERMWVKVKLSTFL
jgi:hypothetical protein